MKYISDNKTLGRRDSSSVCEQEMELNNLQYLVIIQQE